ncbi:MAG: glycosyltransferase family 4 protein [Verrucomicrobia bacterium]|nr:MAG: glycosyltransferase family 4 protein [Verrucomicrobiota bacterium]
MRFVFLTLGYHPDLDGGGYRYATEVAERLAARGHEVHAVYPNPRNRFPAVESRHGVHLHRVPDGTGSFFANWRSENTAARAVLATLLAPGQPRTLVATHQAYFEPAARGWPTVFMYQGAWGLEYRFSQQAKPRGLPRRLLDPWIARMLHRTEARALRAAPAIFVASEYTRRRLPLWHPGVRSPVSVVSGGANFAQFHPAADRDALRRQWNLAPGDFLFLTVRRLDPRMGLSGLLAGFARVAKAHPHARLWLAGRGPQQEALESEISRLGIGQAARLLGFVPEADLPGLYGAADCTLMPSLDLEGFGLATVESLACGTPVLASDAGANPELVGPLSPALVYPTGQSDEPERRLAAILSGKLALPDRTEAARYAADNFRWDRPVDAFEGAWDLHAVNPARPE